MRLWCRRLHVTVRCSPSFREYLQPQTEGGPWRENTAPAVKDLACRATSPRSLAFLHLRRGDSVSIGRSFIAEVLSSLGDRPPSVVQPVNSNRSQRDSRSSSLSRDPSASI